MDIRGTGFGGGMLLFLPAAVAQTLGGVLYEVDPKIPFLVTSAGMVVVTLWAYFKIKDPKEMYT